MDVTIIVYDEFSKGDVNLDLYYECLDYQLTSRMIKSFA